MAGPIDALLIDSPYTSRYQLAKACGVADYNLARINASGRCSLTNAAKIARALGIDASILADTLEKWRLQSDTAKAC